MNFFKKKQTYNSHGLGAVQDPLDLRDKKYEEVLGADLGLSDDEWSNSFDIEKKLDIKIPFKHQNGSSSCVSQGWSYEVAVLEAVETGVYKDVSAKAIYSQIFLPQGGAYIRDGGKLVVNFGALLEGKVPSYDKGTPPSEDFIRDLSWKTSELEKLAKIMQAKEYRVINSVNIDIVAKAIKDNNGVVGGLYVGNNASWRTNDPTPSTRDGGHCVFFGKFGIDEGGKYISTPNSWGADRGKDSKHPDGWQKLRENYFNDTFSFNPWMLLDKSNNPDISPEANSLLLKLEKKIIIEGEGRGRKGIIIDGVLREIKDDNKSREAAACLYSLTNNGFGATVKTKIFDEMNKDSAVF